jgi:hypothetical protein
MMKIALMIGAAAVALVTIAVPAKAGNIDIDFSTYANTFLSSASGVSFSLAPGYAVNGLGTTPFVNAFNNPNEIANSANFGNYPTSNQLIFSFLSPVTNVSFFFNNYGSPSSGRGDSQFYAYDAASSLVSTGDIGSCCGFGGTVAVPGTRIKTLIVDNNTGDPTGDFRSWLFGIDSLSARTVPEPGALALLGGGLVALAGLRFRGGQTLA